MPAIESRTQRPEEFSLTLGGPDRETRERLTEVVLEFRTNVLASFNPLNCETIPELKALVKKLPELEAHHGPAYQQLEILAQMKRIKEHLSGVAWGRQKCDELGRTAAHSHNDEFNILSTMEKLAEQSIERFEARLRKELRWKDCLVYGSIAEASSFRFCEDFVLCPPNYSAKEIEVQAGSQPTKLQRSIASTLLVLIEKLRTRAYLTSRLYPDAEPGEYKYHSVLMEFVRDERRAWALNEPELKRFWEPVLARTADDYFRDRMIPGDVAAGQSAFLFLFSRGPNDTEVLRTRLDAGDYLPLMPLGYGWGKPDKTIMQQAACVAAIAAAECAPVILKKASPWHRRFEECARSLSDIQHTGSSDETRRMYNIMRDLSNLFTRERRDGLAALFNAEFLKHCDLASVLLWRYLTHEIAFPKEGKPGAHGKWLRTTYQKLDALRPEAQFGPATALLVAGVPPLDIMKLYENAESPPHAAKVAKKLLDPRYNEETRELLIGKGAGKPALLELILSGKRAIDAIDLRLASTLDELA